ncbi:MAG: hypothetical protein MHMPM18_001931 [Marteilia pararefringens]
MIYQLLVPKPRLSAPQLEILRAKGANCTRPKSGHISGNRRSYPQNYAAIRQYISPRSCLFDTSIDLN